MKYCAEGGGRQPSASRRYASLARGQGAPAHRVELVDDALVLDDREEADLRRDDRCSARARSADAAAVRPAQTRLRTEDARMQMSSRQKPLMTPP